MACSPSSASASGSECSVDSRNSPPRAHYGTLEDKRLSADEMDERRRQNIAYEYLCHLEEAKVWMEACMKFDLPPSTELEESLMNGVFLGKLAHFFAPNKVSMKKIYDPEQERYQKSGLHFRHTDNINHWLRAMESIGLPKIFYPETTDVYDRKNMPKAVYCLHALSLYLYKLGLAPQIQDLYGKATFTEEEITAMRQELDKYGIQMPAFSKIGGILASEMPVDEAALHAAIIAINDAVDKGDAPRTLECLENPAAHLRCIDAGHSGEYQEILDASKREKVENSKNKYRSSKDEEDSDERDEGVVDEDDMDDDVNNDEDDVYDLMLTHEEIQQHIVSTNERVVLDRLMQSLNNNDISSLTSCLKSPHLGLAGVESDRIANYMQHLLSLYGNSLNSNNNNNILTPVAMNKDQIQSGVYSVNKIFSKEGKRNTAVKSINNCIGNDDDQATLKALSDVDAGIVGVDARASLLYHQLLMTRMQEKGAPLTQEEIQEAINQCNNQIGVALKMTRSLLALNDKLDAALSHSDDDDDVNIDADIAAPLQDPESGIANVYENSSQDYGRMLMKITKDMPPVLDHAVCIELPWFATERA